MAALSLTRCCWQKLDEQAKQTKYIFRQITTFIKVRVASPMNVCIHREADLLYMFWPSHTWPSVEVMHIPHPNILEFTK